MSLKIGRVRFSDDLVIISLLGKIWRRMYRSLSLTLKDAKLDNCIKTVWHHRRSKSNWNPLSKFYRAKSICLRFTVKNWKWELRSPAFPKKTAKIRTRAPKIETGTKIREYRLQHIIWLRILCFLFKIECNPWISYKNFDSRFWEYRHLQFCLLFPPVNKRQINFWQQILVCGTQPYCSSC